VATVYLGLGSNIDAERNLRLAIGELRRLFGELQRVALGVAEVVEDAQEQIRFIKRAIERCLRCRCCVRTASLVGWLYGAKRLENSPDRLWTCCKPLRLSLCLPSTMRGFSKKSRRKDVS